MADKKIEISKKDLIHFSGIRVVVYKNVPNKCPICDNVLSKYEIQLHDDNMKIPEGKICDVCNKIFLNVKAYYRCNKYFKPINQKETELLLKKIEENKLKKNEQKRIEKEKAELEKQKLLKAIMRGLEEQNIKNIPDWKITSTFPLRKMQSVAVMFLVKKNNNLFYWYCIVSQSKKIIHNSNRVIIIGEEHILGRALLGYIASGKSTFNLLNENYQIEATIILNTESYNKILNQYQKESEEINKENKVQIVYVYFRLNNKCMINKHKIISVTAKTSNIKTGILTEVNVFYCETCNKYFINYEALQGYISSGIYPALRFSLEEYKEESLREISELMLYGYTVRDGILTENERHKILGWIIDSGLLSKADIVKDLQFKVNYNGKKVGNENAKQKWKSDIQFVSKYVKGNTIKINTIFERNGEKIF